MASTLRNTLLTHRQQLRQQTEFARVTAREQQLREQAEETTPSEEPAEKAEGGFPSPDGPDLSTTPNKDWSNLLSTLFSDQPATDLAPGETETTETTIELEIPDDALTSSECSCHSPSTDMTAETRDLRQASPEEVIKEYMESPETAEFTVEKDQPLQGLAKALQEGLGELTDPENTDPETTTPEGEAASIESPEGEGLGIDAPVGEPGAEPTMDPTTTEEPVVPGTEAGGAGEGAPQASVEELTSALAALSGGTGEVTITGLPTGEETTGLDGSDPLGATDAPEVEADPTLPLSEDSNRQLAAANQNAAAAHRQAAQKASPVAGPDGQDSARTIAQNQAKVALMNSSGFRGMDQRNTPGDTDVRHLPEEDQLAPLMEQFERVQKIALTVASANQAQAQELQMLREQNEQLTSQLSESKQRVTKMVEYLHEAAVLTTRTALANKLMVEHTTTKAAKKLIQESLNGATTREEAQLIFESLQEKIEKNNLLSEQNTVAEQVNRVFTADKGLITESAVPESISPLAAKWGGIMDYTAKKTK
jgi:hypothetical protein